MFGRKKPRAILSNEEFWSWWGEYKATAAFAIESGELSRLVSEVGEQVHAVDSRLEWEFGPGKFARHAFVITSAGIAETRAIAYRLNRLAPEPDDVFEYHPSRQGDSAATQNVVGFEGVSVSMCDMYASIRTDDQRQLVDVTMYHPTFVKLGIQAQNIAFLYLDWVLGEEGVERWIGEINIVEQCPKDALPADSLIEITSAMASRHAESNWVEFIEEDDSDKRVVTVLRPLKPIDFPVFDQHVVITIDAGTPEQQQALENRIAFAAQQDSVYVANEHFAGVRTFHLYTDSQSDAAARLEEIAMVVGAMASTSRDPEWEAIQAFR